MFIHDYYSKPLADSQRAGLPTEITHAVYTRDEAGSRLVALCASEREAQHVEAALTVFERYARGELQLVQADSR